MSPRVTSILALTLAACFQASHDPQPGPLIGPSGGVVTSSDGKASISIPAGALTRDTAVSMTAVQPLAPPAGTSAAGSAYAISPVVALSQPATVTLPIDGPGEGVEVELVGANGTTALGATAFGASEVQAVLQGLGTVEPVRIPGPIDAGFLDAGTVGDLDAGSSDDDAGPVDAGVVNPWGSCSEALPDLSDVLRWNDAGIGGCDLNGSPCWHVGYACQTFGASTQGWCVVVSDGGPCPGWPCDSDANCNGQEQCIDGGCQEVECPQAPECSSGCTPYLEPHGCTECVCGLGADGGIADGG